jgi:hypothetical protein
MATMIEEGEISHLNLEDAIYRLQDLENYIHNMESKEPPSYEKEDYYYWSMDINDALFERSLLIKRATLLLDKELEEYFNGEFVWFWSKEAACKLLRLAVA